MDPLSATLGGLRFSSAVYCRLHGGSPWGLSVPRVSGASFHILLAGRCSVSSAVGDFELEAGDIALVISGAAQVLGDGSPSEPTPLQDLVERMDETTGVEASLGPPPVRTDIICGAFDFDRRLFDPMLRFLPDVLRLRPGDYRQGLLRSVLTGVEAELDAPRSATQLVLSRLGDILFVEMIRTAVERGKISPDRASWVRALRVPEVLRVLESIHDDVGRKWSVNELAALAGHSRSAFTSRFREVVGMSAQEYLTHWRMIHAATMLRETAESLPAIAGAVGYASEAAFSKAFKATVGVPPGRYRSAASRLDPA